MKAALVYLMLVAYPPCGDPVFEKIISGPFADVELCEEVKKDILKRRGPPKPGSVLLCVVDTTKKLPQ